jgi:choline dehydrogenase-like flavoprotein
MSVGLQAEAWRRSSARDVDTDVCIVGAGPAGITLARELDRAGRRVCLVESGGPDVDRRVQRQSRGTVTGYPLQRLHDSRVRAVGGTLRHPRLGDEGWAVRPLDAIDFAARADLPESGWPLTWEQVQPHYARAQAAAGLDTYDYRAASWVDPGRAPLPGLADHEVETTVFHFAPPIFQEALPELTRSPNVRVLLRSRVVGLVRTADGGTVDGVRVLRDDGSRLVVRADAVVLATGAVENARLLLLGDDGRSIGNDHDLVGRYFGERLSAHCGHIVPTRPDLLDALAFYQQHDVRRTSLRGALRLSDERQRESGLRNCAFMIQPRPALVDTDALRSATTLRKAFRRVPMLPGAGAHAASVVGGLGGVLRSVGRGGLRAQTVTIRCQAEHAPYRDSRVTLGSRRDDLGLPTANLHWRFGEADVESIRTSLAELDATLRASGLGRVESTMDDPRRPTLMEGMHHHMGTTRMNADPTLGVVDGDCRVHSMHNLYVTGGSVFPTYGASNPTLTIIALALRLADHLGAALGAARPHTASAR